ncbi:hypothetical protein Tco_0269910 [Tanacetum coccineum]
MQNPNKTTKSNMPRKKSSASKKPETQIHTDIVLKQKDKTTSLRKPRTPRSCLSATNCRVNSQDCLDLGGVSNWKATQPLHGKAPFLNVQKTFDRSRSSLGLHDNDFLYNRSELGIQDHSNEQSSSKLVPKVVP